MHIQHMADLVLVMFVIEVAEDIRLAKVLIEQLSSQADFVLYLLCIMNAESLPANVVANSLPKWKIVRLQFWLENPLRDVQALPLLGLVLLFNQSICIQSSCHDVSPRLGLEQLIGSKLSRCLPLSQDRVVEVGISFTLSALEDPAVIGLVGFGWVVLLLHHLVDGRHVACLLK